MFQIPVQEDGGADEAQPLLQKQQQQQNKGRTGLWLGLAALAACALALYSWGARGTSGLDLGLADLMLTPATGDLAGAGELATHGQLSADGLCFRRCKWGCKASRKCRKGRRFKLCKKFCRAHGCRLPKKRCQVPAQFDAFAADEADEAEFAAVLAQFDGEDGDDVFDAFDDDDEDSGDFADDDLALAEDGDLSADGLCRKRCKWGCRHRCGRGRPFRLCKKRCRSHFCRVPRRCYGDAAGAGQFAAFADEGDAPTDAEYEALDAAWPDDEEVDAADDEFDDEPVGDDVALAEDGDVSADALCRMRCKWGCRASRRCSRGRAFRKCKKFCRAHRCRLPKRRCQVPAQFDAFAADEAEEAQFGAELAALHDLGFDEDE